MGSQPRGHLKTENNGERGSQAITHNTQHTQHTVPVRVVIFKFQNSDELHNPCRKKQRELEHERVPPTDQRISLTSEWVLPRGRHRSRFSLTIDHVFDHVVDVFFTNSFDGLAFLLGFGLGREQVAGTLRQLADCTTSFIIHPTGNGFQRLSLIPSSTSNGFHSFILRVV